MAKQYRPIGDEIWRNKVEKIVSTLLSVLC
jgi:hypothetical protein